MTHACYLLLLLALLALVVEPGPRLRIPARIRRRLRRSRSHGPGASAAARARQLRTPAVRVADRLGIPTQRGSEANRWEAGAEGERRTARRLAELEAEGWTVLHDRALPGSRANLDHLAVSWSGVVFVVDTKRWSAYDGDIAVRDGRLFHGDRDVTDRLNGVRHERTAVAKALGHRFRVVAVVVVDGPACDGWPLLLDGIHIVPATEACHRLRALARTRPAYDGDVVGRAVRDLFPPYGQRGPR
ncbi:nuclease-related domain-containing protein [Streptomyces asoensis]|uniref:nuclease-related domain-containing protein n=1 Tax=Streptomyces asoensis TaxID=249586 RepID=UPI00369389B2